jgi:hypothetical protein
MSFPHAKTLSRPVALIVMVCSLLLTGCFFEKPTGPRAPGSTLDALNEMTGIVYPQTGPIQAADLRKMSTSGKAYFTDRFLTARMKNHLDQPLGQVTLRVVIIRGKVRADDSFVRNLIVPPHSEFQVTVKVKRQPRKNETWAWSLVTGIEGEDPR